MEQKTRVIGHGEDGDSIFKSKWGVTSNHGIARGVIVELRGSRFKTGFIRGFAGHYAPNLGINGADAAAVIGRSTVAGVWGGMISEASGGNFRDGALHASMVHLFNQGMTYKALEGISDSELFRLSIDVFEDARSRAIKLNKTSIVELMLEYNIDRLSATIGKIEMGGDLARWQFKSLMTEMQTGINITGLTVLRVSSDLINPLNKSWLLKAFSIVTNLGLPDKRTTSHNIRCNGTNCNLDILLK